MMLKKMVLLFVLLSVLLMACDSNDQDKEANYEGEGNTWRAELEYQEDEEDGQINSEIDLVISYNDQLGESEPVNEISYRLELEDLIVFQNTETYDDTEDVSALYIEAEGTVENSLSSTTRIILKVEWDGQEEEFQLDPIEED